MGITTVEVEIGVPNDGDRWESLEFLVDSGAVYSVVPAAVLERLGIRPVSEEVFRLANGDKITRRKGIAAFRLGKELAERMSCSVNPAIRICSAPSRWKPLGLRLIRSSGSCASFQ